MFHGYGDRVFGGVGQLSREHLVEDDAQRVQVTPGRHGLAHRLLGCHVAGGAEYHAPLGDRGCRGRPGDAKVSHLGAARGGEQDVVGFDVPVYDAPFVGGLQGFGDLERYRGRGPRIQRPIATDALLERASRHVLHGYVRRSGFLAAVIDRDDVGVGEGRGAQRFALEALGELLVTSKLLPQDLQRHVPIEDLVVGQVYFGHPSATQGADDAVAVVYDGFLHETVVLSPLITKTIYVPYPDFGLRTFERSRSPEPEEGLTLRVVQRSARGKVSGSGGVPLV